MTNFDYFRTTFEESYFLLLMERFIGLHGLLRKLVVSCSVVALVTAREALLCYIKKKSKNKFFENVDISLGYS